MELRRCNIGRGGQGGLEEFAVPLLGGCWCCCCGGGGFGEGVLLTSERGGLDAVVAVEDAMEEGVGAFAGCAGAGDGGWLWVRWEEGG